MQSTTHNLTTTPPNLNENGMCGRYLRMPDCQARVAEGGLRMNGKYKSSTLSQPLVTVITVVLNREQTIRQCLTSVLGQSYGNIEYIVIDGASTDKTLDIISEYAEAIDYYVSEPDTGIYNAMNKGIALSSGNYIVLLNSDDWYHIDAVKSLVNAARSSNADVTHADAIVVNHAGSKQYDLKGWLNDGIYTRGAPLRHETMLVKRELYDQIGYYDESYPIIADYVFMLAIYHAGASFFHLKQSLLYFRSTGISNTAHGKRSEERMRIFKEYFPFLDNDDLNHFKVNGRIPVDTRLELIEKHKGKSELFVRSMAFNIATQAIFETKAHLNANAADTTRNERLRQANNATLRKALLRVVKRLIRV